MKVYARPKQNVLEDRSFQGCFTIGKEYLVITDFVTAQGTAIVGVVDDKGDFLWLDVQNVTFEIVDDLAVLEQTLTSLLEALTADTLQFENDLIPFRAITSKPAIVQTEIYSEAKSEIKAETPEQIKDADTKL